MERLKALNEIKTKYHFKDTIARHTQGKVYAISLKETIVPPGEIVVEEKKELLDIAAIVSLTNDDYVNDNGGHYDRDSRKLYCYKLLKKGSKIINEMNNGTIREYTIHEHEDKSDYDDELHIYYMVRSDLDDKG